MCPMEAYVHVMAIMTIAYVPLMCGEFPPARLSPVTDYTIARNVIMSHAAVSDGDARFLR